MKTYDELLTERDALAFVLTEYERLHKEINAILHPNGGAPEKPSLCDLVSYLRSDMAEIRAEAGRKGFIACFTVNEMCGVNKNNIEQLSNQYAAKVRQDEQIGTWLKDSNVNGGKRGGENE